MKTKQCFKCKLDKELSEFYKHPQMGDGHVNKCKECNKIDVRDNYSIKRDYYIQYDKKRYLTEDRQIEHRYKGIVDRSTGKGTHKYSVEGKKYLSYASFIKWWKSHRGLYLSLYARWLVTNCKKSYAPSIDRIDNKKGYIPSNMRWITHGENSSKKQK